MLRILSIAIIFILIILSGQLYILSVFFILLKNYYG